MLYQRYVRTLEIMLILKRFIIGVVQGPAISGQKAYHADLEKAVRAHLQSPPDYVSPGAADEVALILPSSSAPILDDVHAASAELDSAPTIEGHPMEAVPITSSTIKPSPKVASSTMSSIILVIFLLALTNSMTYTWVSTNSFLLNDLTASMD